LSIAGELLLSGRPPSRESALSRGATFVKRPPIAWFASILAASLAVVAAGYGRGLLEQRASRAAARQFSRELQTLDARQAARRIGQLPAAEGPWLEVLVAAWADPRGEVAQAARLAVLSEVERWSQQPATEFEPPLGDLGRLLAQHAPRMKSVEREAARALAERLLLWPAEGSRRGTTQLIADCQAVLGLPPEPASEIRLAASPVPAAMPPVAPPVAALPLPDAVSPTPSPAPIPPPAEPLLGPPLPLADANQETPARPRPFVAPKAIRISDD